MDPNVLQVGAVICATAAVFMGFLVVFPFLMAFFNWWMDKVEDWLK